jgi:hypothetical protein
MSVLKIIVLALLASVLAAPAAVHIDQQAFGASLGGWTKRGNQAAEYPLSGASYRTYKPEVSPTPDGGLFLSLRIDHVRGWLASDDHAVLEITVSAKGNIESAQSTIAIQGRSITTDLIRSGTDAGQKLVGMDRAVQIGTDLVADLSAKMLREKIVEPGRVSYPAVLRHNYNLLFQAIRTEAAPCPTDKPATTAAPGEPSHPPDPTTTPPLPTPAATPAATPVPPTPAPPTPAPATPAPAAKPVEPPAPAAKLEIKTVGEGTKSELPVKQ